jgi:hypothetical protein
LYRWKQLQKDQCALRKENGKEALESHALRNQSCPFDHRIFQQCTFRGHPNWQMQNVASDWPGRSVYRRAPCLIRPTLRTFYQGHSVGSCSPVLTTFHSETWLSKASNKQEVANCSVRYNEASLAISLRISAGYEQSTLALIQGVQKEKM